MTNLEIITAARKMGYSAVLKRRIDNHSRFGVAVAYCFNVVSIEEDNEVINLVDVDGGIVKNFYKNVEEMKITGFLYVGHLFGEPVVPIGQKFRGKITGKFYTFKRMVTNELLEVSEGGKGTTKVYRSEIEPYFG